MDMAISEKTAEQIERKTSSKLLWGETEDKYTHFQAPRVFM
jgi:hypothetical protein